MLERLEGRMWHGDHLVDAATAGDVARLLAVQDGTETDGGLVYRVHEFTTAVEGAVVVNGFDRQLPRKAPVDAPLRQLADATKVEVERVGPATVLVASIAGPDSAEDSDELFRELFRQSGVVLATVRWGDVATWVPAEPSRGAPAAAVGSAFLLALAPHERVVPSLAAARSRLAEEGGAPGGERGQRLRESGQTWPSVPTVDSWEDEASDPWVLAALLESAMSPRGESRSTIYSPPVPRMTPLVPGGAPVLVAPAGIGFALGAHDGVLTLWEGKDDAGRTVGVAVHRSTAEMPAVELPLWPSQPATDSADGWLGEVMEHVDEQGYVDLCRLRVTPVGRLTFPSRRIVASDPCVAGRASTLGLELPGEGPFPVLRADLIDVTDAGTELDVQARGILLVIDESRPPIRWEAARDASGEVLHCDIDSGQLLLADADGAGHVQREYDEGTVDFGATARVALLRSDPVRPADIAVLADLAGDGPGWVVVGVSEDERPVAVLVANFDPLS